MVGKRAFVLLVLVSLLGELCSCASLSRSSSESRTSSASLTGTPSSTETSTATVTPSKTRTATMTRSRSWSSSSTQSRSPTRSSTVSFSPSISFSPAPSPIVTDATLSFSAVVIRETFTKAGQRALVRLHTGSDDSGGSIVSYRVDQTPITGVGSIFIRRGAIPDTVTFDASGTDVSGVNAVTVSNTNAVHYILVIANTDDCVCDIQIIQTSATTAAPTSTPAPYTLPDYGLALIILAAGVAIAIAVIIIYFCCCRTSTYRTIIKNSSKTKNKPVKSKKPTTKGKNPRSMSSRSSKRAASPRPMTPVSIMPRPGSPQFMPMMGPPRFMLPPPPPPMMIPVSSPPIMAAPPQSLVQRPASPTSMARPVARPLSLQSPPAEQWASPEPRRAVPMTPMGQERGMPPQSLPPQVVQQQQRRQLAQQLEQQQQPQQQQPAQRATSPAREAQRSPTRAPAPSLAPFIPPSTYKRPTEDQSGLQRQLDQQQQELDLQRKIILAHRDENTYEIETLKAKHEREMKREREERMEEDARRERKLEEERRLREESERELQRRMGEQREREKERDLQRDRERELEEQAERERRERDRKREREREEAILASVEKQLAPSSTTAPASQYGAPFIVPQAYAPTTQPYIVSAPAPAPAPATTAMTPPPPPAPLPGDPYKCIQTFTPSNVDEIPMFFGDHIRVLEVFDDGWARATRPGGATGMVPMNMLKPLPAGARPPTSPGTSPPPASPPAAAPVPAPAPAPAPAPQTIIVYAPPPPPAAAKAPVAAATAAANPARGRGTRRTSGSGDSWDELDSDSGGYPAGGPARAARAPLLGSGRYPGQGVVREYQPQPQPQPQAAQRAPMSPPREMRAIQEYRPERKDEMPVRAGEVVTVLKRHPDGWAKVRAAHGGEGFVPLNYFVPLYGEAAPAAVPAAFVPASAFSQPRTFTPQYAPARPANFDVLSLVQQPYRPGSVFEGPQSPPGPPQFVQAR